MHVAIQTVTSFFAHFRTTARASVKIMKGAKLFIVEYGRNHKCIGDSARCLLRSNRYGQHPGHGTAPLPGLPVRCCIEQE